MRENMIFFENMFFQKMFMILYLFGTYICPIPYDYHRIHYLWPTMIISKPSIVTPCLQLIAIFLSLNSLSSLISHILVVNFCQLDSANFSRSNLSNFYSICISKTISIPHARIMELLIHQWKDFVWLFCLIIFYLIKMKF